jgi:mannitol-1-/sugar-/sorbitol-6-/2-deoxyglucose-6-phosphatase
MIKAVIFDFDGIIVDSEPAWAEAEMKVFSSVGIDLTPEMCKQTTGLDTQETVRYWQRFQPWSDKSVFQVFKEIIEEMQGLLLNKVDLKEGFLDVLQLLVDKKLPLSVASSSPLKLITSGLKKFHLFDYFKIINSAENEETGKPHPALFIGTARKLGIDPTCCLVFEDSFNGAIAAKAARMKLVAVPEKQKGKSSHLDFADVKLSSLKDFSEKHFEQLNSLI